MSCVGLPMEKKSRTEKNVAMLKVETCEMYPKHSEGERERERQRVDMAHPVPLKFLPYVLTVTLEPKRE